MLVVDGGGGDEHVLAGPPGEGADRRLVVRFEGAVLIVGRGAPDLFASPAVDAVDLAWRLEDVEWRRVCDDLLVSGTIARRGA